MGINLYKRESENLSQTMRVYFFQNEEIFVQLDELDELDRITHAWIKIYLQSHTSTENILV